MKQTFRIFLLLAAGGFISSCYSMPSNFTGYPMTSEYANRPVMRSANNFLKSSIYPGLLMMYTQPLFYASYEVPGYATGMPIGDKTFMIRAYTCYGGMFCKDNFAMKKIQDLDLAEISVIDIKYESYLRVVTNVYFVVNGRNKYEEQPRIKIQRTNDNAERKQNLKTFKELTEEENAAPQSEPQSPDQRQ